MKTQLLEDIGQSATLSLVPAKKEGASPPPVAEDALAPQASQATSPRAAFGVWRQKAVVDAVVVDAANQPDQQALHQDLDSVFEEIAALEAQYVPPSPHQEPVTTALAPPPAITAPESLHVPATPEPALDTFWTQNPNDRPDPLFDFTPPAPGSSPVDPFTPAPAAMKASQQRYLVWGALALSAVLFIQGGRWIYDQRGGGDVALAAIAAKEEPQVDKAAQRRVLAAKEFTLKPNGDVSVAPSKPASSARPVASTAATPPLVLLESAFSPAPAAESSGKVETGAANRQAATTNRPVAEKHSSRSRETSRGQSSTAASSAGSRDERVTNSQLASASAKEPESPAKRGGLSAATLKACREHGYHAAQCVKRACTMTKYGFVCRGR
ncbi:hypothetical protein KY495_09840 [Massilia sp. PAMC28688]|uniref:hypothetical protein n=1 Tax=Massilia sp. PAMC28688 TaxID=2861283 RepID=UPI001C633DBA|nr:hypothetical protein [Massilia sp. PAMC28688]QYF95420.1 hypothetical protein KY495_09840 [Massilia sp. PAMC28688]